MADLTSGARQLPLRHISIRVPWNDTGWEGKVCQCPSDNMACLILPRIRETREDEKEEELAGQSWENLKEKQLPPCMNERGSFMAPFNIFRELEHPYMKRMSPAHQHMLPTPFRHPAYSAACIPFNWMLKEQAVKKAEALGLDYSQNLEDRAHDKMGFTTNWVQTKENQLALLDTFFSALRPQQSLCFFYAKQIPLVEDSRRVLIGVGWVNHIGNAIEYQYEKEGPIKSIIWDRPIQHSIREGFQDGFLLPYHQVIAYLEAHPEDDPAKYIAFAPEEHFAAFSFVSELVTNDAAIASLLACAKALENIQKIAEGPWDGVVQWINARLNELWQMRGPYPGFGAALAAFEILSSALFAYEIEKYMAEEGISDPWPLLDGIIRDPQRYPRHLGVFVMESKRKEWLGLPDERRTLLKLLSRFEITPEQARRYYEPADEQRAKLDIHISGQAILENPYQLYECDRRAQDPISLSAIDRGLFPEGVIRENYPLDPPSGLEDPTDSRRVRAFVIRELEKAAQEGHTLQTKDYVIP